MSNSTGTRFRPTFVWWVVLAGLAIAGILGVLAVQVTRGFGQTEALRREVIRSYETRAELMRILSLHQDIETGQRGYVLTSDPRFLEPYNSANAAVESAFARLAHEESGPWFTPEIAELRQASRLKQRFARESVELTRAGRLREAADRVAAGEGKRLMDRIRAIIGEIDSHERSQLAARTDRAEQARHALQRQLLALQGLLLALLAIALAFLVRTRRGWLQTLRRERDLAARQEAIFDSARDGMIVINASGGMESLNPAAARMFGYEIGELVRRDVGTLFEVAPDRGLMETFLKRLAARRLGAMSDMQEIVGRCRDGSLIPVEVSVSHVEIEGQPRFLAVLRDITERRQVDRMKTEFVSTVSHELRTPLTSISGSLGLVAGGAAGELPTRAQRLVEIAQTNCARLIRLINDILDIEKIESGRMVFAIKPLELARLLPAAIEATQAFGDSHGVAFELGEVPGDAVVMGDEDRVIQVVTNLLSNAAKFSPQGEAVQVTVTPLDRRFRISVADKGPGIPEEFRGRIFGKFAQADSSDTRQKGGTGLGLNIVREIVERLGGAVSFDSVPGQGATFHVDLPATAAPHDPHAQPDRLGRISEGDGAVVLHVDDDPDMLRIVASALEGSAEVHSTPSVLEARAALQRYSFDAVILDLGMADGDGADLIPVVRERGNVPIVVFTAQDAEPGQLAGVDAVLVKSRDSLDRLAGEVTRLIQARAIKELR